MSHVFGPVPSRRLGFSLGVDIVPLKTCTLDCVYCQVGNTTHKTLERNEYVSPDVVIDDIQEVLKKDTTIDYITFSGSGEPTLNSALGVMIRRIKSLCAYPVAVITNGTLLYLPEVRQDLLGADLVIPSLDAITPAIFNKVNRPSSGLDVGKIIEGLALFQREFKGRLWIEVLIVKGVNDSREELHKINAVVQRIAPDKIQINSIFRPGAEKDFECADADTLEYARDLFGPKAEIIGEFKKERTAGSQGTLTDDILQLLKRRPCSVKQLSLSLGVDPKLIVDRIAQMHSDGRIRQTEHDGDSYYSGVLT